MIRAIERQLAVAVTLRSRLRAAGWRIVNDTELPLVCFTHPSLGRGQRVADVARLVNSRGRAWISEVTVRDAVVLRACITHEDSAQPDVEVLVRESREDKLTEVSTSEVRTRQRAELTASEADRLDVLVSDARAQAPREQWSHGNAQSVLEAALQ